VVEEAIHGEGQEWAWRRRFSHKPEFFVHTSLFILRPLLYLDRARLPD